MNVPSKASTTGATPVLHAVPSAGRRPVAEVDSWALKANWRTLSLRSGKARAGAAIKANAYGLGCQIAAKALFGSGCRDFFVAWPEEGERVREAMPGKNYRIFVLQGLDASGAAICRENKLIPILSTPDDIATWRSTAPGSYAGTCAIQLETGMNRLGLTERDAANAAQMAREGGLDIALVMSHLASADTPADAQNREQLERFRHLTRLFPFMGRSLANSAGVYLGPDYHFDLTRPGITLYGGEAHLDPDQALRPVVTLKAHVLQIREMAAGEAIGYGATQTLTRPSRVATVGIGYADGYLRSASSGAKPEAVCMFAHGQRLPVLGRVSMDLASIDITDLPEAALAPGDAVEVFGPNIGVDEVASRSGTIAYEFLTSLGSRVQRNWV